jgi:hypothetical protein
MHIRGHGDPAKLAGLVRQALAETKTPFEPSSTASSQAAKLDLDTDQLDQSLGAQEKINGGVYQFSIPRKETATENGMPAPAAMGTGTAINFQPTIDGKAAIAGDFVVTAEELNPMISALRENGIEVVAIHSHMLEEQPRLFFVHFWANDDANLQEAFARHLTKWRLRGAEQTSRRDTLWLAELVGVECGLSLACDARLFCRHLVHLRGAL